MIIGIIGKENSGKDTLAAVLLRIILQDQIKKGVIPNCQVASDQIIINHLHETQYPEDFNWKLEKFSKPIKAIVSYILNVPPHTLEDRVLKESNIDPERWGDLTVRDLMVIVGEGLRALLPNIWSNSADNRLGDGINYMFSDVRHLVEADVVRSRGGILIRITSDKEKRKEETQETALDDYLADFEITNSRANVSEEEAFATLVGQARAILRAKGIVKQ